MTGDWLNIGIAVAELAILPVGLVFIEVFKKSVAAWHSPSPQIDAVTYYRTLVAGLAVIMVMTDLFGHGPLYKLMPRF